MRIPNKKIYIIGPAGSGKTTLANKLHAKYHLPVLSLDNIFWRKKYSQEYNSIKKQELLQNFLKNNSNGWIIEGAPQEFLKPISRQATKIIWLNPSITTLLCRTSKRFISAKLHKSKNFQNKNSFQRETFQSFLKIITGIISYKRKNSLYHQHKMNNSIPKYN